MRVFVGLDIPQEIRARLLDYIERLKREAPDVPARWTRPEGWHVTLKFIGETQRAEEIKKLLAGVKAAPFEIRFPAAGFFTPRAPRVFYVDVKAPEALPRLAKQVDEAVAKVGIRQEKSKYSPHLTLARFGSGRSRGARSDQQAPQMNALQCLFESRPELAQIDFGTMTAQEFFLYQSVLHPKGAIYTKIASYPLK